MEPIWGSFDSDGNPLMVPFEGGFGNTRIDSQQQTQPGNETTVNPSSPHAPNLGDYYIRPSAWPAPFSAPCNPGVGFYNDGSKPRHHGRRTSGRGFEMPAGSYGLHGHDIVPNDVFEKLYYEKHPELLKKECGQYGRALGDGRGEWALSSDDLNRIVRETASRGAGLGKYGLTDIFMFADT
jgi:hypothetical protein